MLSLPALICDFINDSLPKVSGTLPINIHEPTAPPTLFSSNTNIIKHFAAELQYVARKLQNLLGRKMQFAQDYMFAIFKLFYKKQKWKLRKRFRFLFIPWWKPADARQRGRSIKQTAALEKSILNYYQEWNPLTLRSMTKGLLEHCAHPHWRCSVAQACSVNRAGILND